MRAFELVPRQRAPRGDTVPTALRVPLRAALPVDRRQEERDHERGEYAIERLRFALGLWLALLLNRHMPFKSLIRAVVLLPFIVPTFTDTKVGRAGVWVGLDKKICVIGPAQPSNSRISAEPTAASYSPT